MVSLPFRRRRPFFPRSFSSFGGFLLALTVIAGLAGCHPKVTDPKDPKFVVAETKNWTITRADLDKEIDTFLKEQKQTLDQVGPAKMPMLENKILHVMVLKKLILARAATLPLKDVDKDEAAAIEQLKGRFPSEAEFQQQLATAGITLDELKKRIHEEILIHKTLEQEAFVAPPPSDQEINDFYLKNKDKFDIPDKIRASRIIILVDDKTSPADKAAKKKAIDKAHARVAGGEDFSKVATEVSEDRYSAPKGGDIGYFQKGENEANFDEVAFATKPGAVSPVFETPMGYQFIKVTDVHPGGEVSIAQARGIITKYLSQQKEQQEEKTYTDKLLTDSGVTFHLVGIDPTGTQAPATPTAATAPTDTNATAPAMAPAGTNAAPQ
jgi:parvulin-like peptidyl-prolyl isomerase